MADLVAVGAITAYFYGLTALVPLLAAIIALSSIDDLAVDLLWVWGQVRRRWPARSRPPRWSADDLADVPPQPIAMLIPAWDEAAVIGAMLDATLARCPQPELMLFVGCYPNDPGTQLAVSAVAQRDPRVRLVVMAAPGPTCKADCLCSSARNMISATQE